MNSGLNRRYILIILAFVSIILGGTMLAGLIVSLIYSESDMGKIFISLMFIYIALGVCVAAISKRRLKTRMIKMREGILAVTLCWVFAATLCTMPYLLAGSHHSFIDAFFESTSCITTTGATLIDDLTLLPKSLLFWRQLTTWLGGLGIIVFAITIIPMLGFGAANLANAETTGQTTEKIRARITDTARGILFIFLIFTGAEIVFLVLGNIDIYDAIILAFSCMGNGGFASYQAGVTLGNSIYAEVIIVIFCIVASLSFVGYQLLFKRRLRDFFKVTEIRIYLLMIAFVCVLVFIILFASGVYDMAGEAARDGFFQVISFATTAGYAGADFNHWPQATHWLLIAVMIIGGCSGSTAGGIKIGRAAVALLLVRRNIYKRLHPNAVVAVKLGDQVIPEERVTSISTFTMLYAFIALLSCFVLSFDNLNMETTLSAVIAMMSNTGLVIGSGIDPGGSLAVFSGFSRVYMSLLMIAGRLELLTLVFLFSPSFWRRYR